MSNVKGVGTYVYNRMLAFFGGQIGKLSREKVPNTFPTTDAGKVLLIGSDGAVAPTALPTETWTFTLDDDTTVTKKVVVAE